MPRSGKEISLQDEEGNVLAACTAESGFNSVVVYIADNAALWEKETDSLPVNSVGATIGTHVGPGAIAVAFVAKQD